MDKLDRTIQLSMAIKHIGTREAFRVMSKEYQPPEAWCELFVAMVGLDFSQVLSTKSQWGYDHDTGKYFEILSLDIE